MKIGRNDPCPCGSGKKYKQCCMDKPGVPLPPNVVGFPYPGDGGEFNPKNVKMNTTGMDNGPKEKYSGLTEAQMVKLMEVFPGKPGALLEFHPERLTKNEITEIPLFRLLNLIVDKAARGGGRLKLTPSGNFRRELVQEIEKKFPDYGRIASDSIRSQNDSPSASLAAVLGTMSGLLVFKKTVMYVNAHSYGRMCSDPAGFYMDLLDCIFKQFTWLSFTPFTEEYDVIEDAWQFNLYILHSCARRYTNERILGILFHRAFPELFVKPEDKALASLVYIVTFLSRAAYLTGLVESRSVGAADQLADLEWRITPLFDKLLEWKIPPGKVQLPDIPQPPGPQEPAEKFRGKSSVQIEGIAAEILDMLTHETGRSKKSLVEQAILAMAEQSARRKGDKYLYQIRVELKEIEPKIWRRFIVGGGIMLAELHKILQEVMGWEDAHLYGFDIKGQWYELPGNEFADGSERSVYSAMFGELQLKKNTTFTYIYDFGDDWQHLLTVEEVFENDGSFVIPRCLDGARCCPPEDCGSESGYQRMLETLKKPQSTQAKEYFNWLGYQYDPEEFEPDDVNAELLQLFELHL